MDGSFCTFLTILKKSLGGEFQLGACKVWYGFKIFEIVGVFRNSNVVNNVIQIVMH